MRKYSVLVKGKNLKITIEGETGKHGFFTTRYVEADNESEAKRIAVNLIKAEIGSTVLNDSGDPPEFLFEDVLDINNFGNHDVPGSGFTWFEEK